MTKIFICGDINNHSFNGDFIDSSIHQVIDNSDYAVCNYEGTNLGGDYVGKDMVQHPSTLDTLKKAGFDLLLLANNHITDYGETGLRSTITKIKSLGFDYTGAGFNYEEVYSPLIKKIGNLTYGFVNVCEAQVGQFTNRDKKYGYAWLGSNELILSLTRLKDQVDKIIVFMHAGLENYILPLKEYRRFYRFLCDLGADCVVASHPHVAQGVENYNKSLIFYSLGNFYFPRNGKNDDNKDRWNTSFSIVLNFDNDDVSYKVIHHTIDDDKVHIWDPPFQYSENHLSEILKSKHYDKLIQKQNIDAFYAKVTYRYKSVFCGSSSSDGIFQTVKHIINYLFRRKTVYRETEIERLRLLLRLNENDTTRFMLIDAIETLLNNNFKQNNLL